MKASAIQALPGPRILLRGLASENIRTHFQWNNDEELHRLEYDQPFRRESYGSFARRFEAMSRGADPTSLHFEVHLQNSADPLIGIASLTGIDSTNHRASLAVTIARSEARGRGLGKEVVAVLLSHAFERLSLNRIETSSLGFNAPWRSLLARTGFQREGCARNHVFREGRYWDREYWALLASDFRSMRDGSGSEDAGLSLKTRASAPVVRLPVHLFGSLQARA